MKIPLFGVHEPRGKIPILVFISEIKIVITLKCLNFLILLSFKMAIIKFMPMCQLSREGYNFLSRHFVSNLMFPACLLGIVMAVNSATEKWLDISI